MQNLHEILYSWEPLKSHTCQKVNLWFLLKKRKYWGKSLPRVNSRDQGALRPSLESSRVNGTGPAQSFSGVTNAAQLRLIYSCWPIVATHSVQDTGTKLLWECDKANPTSPAVWTRISASRVSLEWLVQTQYRTFLKWLAQTSPQFRTPPMSPIQT